MAGKKSKSESLVKAKKLADAVDGVPLQKEMVPKGAPEPEDKPDIFSGLTERQKIIQRLALRKFTQRSIAAALDISPALVNRELGRIREVHQARGTNVDRAAVVGETLTVYEEVEARCWEVFQTTPMDQVKIKALETVMKARAEHMRLLSSLNLLDSDEERTRKDAASAQAALLGKFEDTVKKLLVEKLIDHATMSKLDEPEKPKENDEVPIPNVSPVSELAEPSPPEDA